MSQSLQTTFLKRPSTIAYMARAFVPSPGLESTRGFPPIRLEWKNVSVDQKDLSAFLPSPGLVTDTTCLCCFPMSSGSGFRWRS